MSKGLSIALFVWLMLLSFFVSAMPQRIDGLYVNSFGHEKDPAVIFVHGGPGYNSHDFEVTTAQALADEGYHVVVYDQRGQGRSDEAPASSFTYKQYADDIKKIMETLGIQKPILIGHSHGGPVSLKFDQIYPGLVKSIVLVAAPMYFWGTLQSLLANCSAKFSAIDDTKSLDTLAYIYYQLAANPHATVDTRTRVAAMAFSLGQECGLYKTKNPTSSELRLRDLLKQNPLSGPLTGALTAMPGFQANEDYLRVNMIDHVIANRSHIFGIYGDEDGLFSPLELSLIRNALQQGGEPRHYRLIPGASHGIFIDQQEAFLDAFKAFTRSK